MNYVVDEFKKMILVSRSKKKVIGLDGYGIKIIKQENKQILFFWGLRHTRLILRRHTKNQIW